MDKKIVLSAHNIFKAYHLGSEELPILKGLNFDLFAQDAVSIQGSSGAGKSTFLHILGTLDRPDKGELLYEGENLFQYEDEKLSQFRNDKLGFVFQFHHLISEFNALENVLLPCRVAGEDLKSAELKAEEILHFMGLKDRLRHYPNELSGGELQRVAIARALVRKPQILLADEPTGNLDSFNSGRVQELFFQLREKLQICLVVVTHDPQFAKKFPKSLIMKDGQWA